MRDGDNRRSIGIVGAFVIMGIVGRSDAPAYAQPVAEPASAPAPTSARGEAQRLYRAGNELFVDRSYTDALEKYRAAVALWDHAAIHFNMAECFVSLVQPLDAYRHLERALAHGPAPFESEEHYQRGVQLKERLLAQLGTLTITATEPGARVSLDGKEVALVDNAAAQVVLPGVHQLVVSKPGFLTSSQSVVFSPGEAKAVQLELTPVPTPLVATRRWRRWVPWAVSGLGATVMLVGVPLMALADSNFEAYDQAITAMCTPQLACDRSALPDSAQRLRRRGDTEKLSAQILWSAGGAILFAGTVMTILNQPHMTESRRPRPGLAIRPAGATVTMGWTF